MDCLLSYQGASHLQEQRLGWRISHMQISSFVPKITAGVVGCCCSCRCHLGFACVCVCTHTQAIRPPPHKLPGTDTLYGPLPHSHSLSQGCGKRSDIKKDPFLPSCPRLSIHFMPAWRKRSSVSRGQGEQELGAADIFVPTEQLTQTMACFFSPSRIYLFYISMV